MGHNWSKTGIILICSQIKSLCKLEDLSPLCKSSQGLWNGSEGLIIWEKLFHFWVTKIVQGLKFFSDTKKCIRSINQINKLKANQKWSFVILNSRSWRNNCNFSNVLYSNMFHSECRFSLGLLSMIMELSVIFTPFMAHLRIRWGGTVRRGGPVHLRLVPLVGAN